MKKPVGIWVKVGSKVQGWLEESEGVPAEFASVAEAKEWINNRVVHPSYYEVRLLKRSRKKNA